MGDSDTPLSKHRTAPISEPNKSLPFTLPEELIAEVLSFLTVKSISRFKCVCKYWYSLISNPFFIKQHLLKSSQNPCFAILPQYILGLEFRVHTCLRNNRLTLCRLLENQSITVANYPLVDTCESHYVIGSCNGLICLLQENHVNNDEYHEFSLRFWNPTTKSLSKKLGTFLNALWGSNPIFQYTFGYDNLSDKYKVVAFCPNEVRVFTSDDNVWKNIQSFPIDPYYNSRNRGVYLRNSLNWLTVYNKVFPSYNPWESCRFNFDQFLIISLDLGMETYTLLHLPRSSSDEVAHAMPIVCVLMNRLCFTHFTEGDEFVIWQMREFGAEDSWTKLFQFSYQCVRNIYDCDRYINSLPLHVIENGDTLILVIRQDRFGKGQLIRYNRKDNGVENIGITNDMYWFLAKHYVESLESIC